MTNKPPLARRVAVVLVAHAANALPNHRAAWAQAIRNEIQHVAGDFNALAWAVGCVFASYSERINAVNARPTIVIFLLSVLGLLLVFASLVAAEFVATRELALLLPTRLGVPVTLYRVVILSLTAVPVAYLTGYGLTRWVPVLSFRIILTIALLLMLVIGLLQLYVYAPTVLGASLLKIVSVIIPLALVAYRNRPAHLV